MLTVLQTQGFLALFVLWGVAAFILAIRNHR
jgi:hypothetical protein